MHLSQNNYHLFIQLLRNKLAVLRTEHKILKLFTYSILEIYFHTHINTRVLNVVTGSGVSQWFAASQWSSGNTPDCGVREPRFISHRG